MGLEFDLQLKRDAFMLNLKGNFTRETVGIYGHSGAGKTTLFNLINGYLKPDSGYIKLGGNVLVDMDNGIFLPAHKRNIGVVFQDKKIFPHMSVKSNLLFGVKYSRERKFRLDEVTEILDLKRLLHKDPSTLSGGEEQRVAIGRALMISPKLLLMDEPFNAVDYSLRDIILPYIKKVVKDYNIPTLIISHDLQDLEILTDNIYGIDNGHNCTISRPQNLFVKDKAPLFS